MAFLEARNSLIKGGKSSILEIPFPLMSKNVRAFKVRSFLIVESLLLAKFKQCRLARFSTPSNLLIFKSDKSRHVIVFCKIFNFGLNKIQLVGVDLKF